MSEVHAKTPMQRLLAAAGWDAGSIRHKQLEDALEGAHLRLVTDWEDQLTNVIPWCDACRSYHRPGMPGCKDIDSADVC